MKLAVASIVAVVSATIVSAADVVAPVRLIGVATILAVWALTVVRAKEWAAVYRLLDGVRGHRA